MKTKTYYRTTGVIFLVVGIMHLLRVLYGWSGIIGTFVVPMWLSWVLVILTGCLAYQGLRSR